MTRSPVFAWAAGIFTSLLRDVWPCIMVTYPYEWRHSHHTARLPGSAPPTFIHLSLTCFRFQSIRPEPKKDAGVAAAQRLKTLCRCHCSVSSPPDVHLSFGSLDCVRLSIHDQNQISKGFSSDTRLPRKWLTQRASLYDFTWFSSAGAMGSNIVLFRKKGHVGLVLTQCWGTRWRGSSRYSHLQLQARLYSTSPISISTNQRSSEVFQISWHSHLYLQALCCTTRLSIPTI